MKTVYILFILLALSSANALAQNGKSIKEGLSYEEIGNSRYRLVYRTKQKFDTLFVYGLNSTDGVGRSRLSRHTPAAKPDGVYVLDTVTVKGQMSYYVRLKRKGGAEGLESNIVTIINERETEFEIEEIDSGGSQKDMKAQDRQREYEPDPDEYQPLEREVQVDMNELRRNTVFPDLAERKGLEGRVNVQVLIGADGQPKKFRILYTPSAELSQPAIDAIKKTKFTPAAQGGMPVASWIVIPVVFILR